MFRKVFSKQVISNSKNLIKSNNSYFTNFVNASPTVTKRFVSKEEEEAYKKNLTREYIEELISTVLTDEQIETTNTEELKRLCTLTTNKDEFIEVLKSTVKLSTLLQYQGDQEVGYRIKKKPIRVAVTGAAGNIGYALIPRIISGEVFGPFQPVILHLIERPDAIKQLEGSVMEFKDMAMPLCRGIVATSDLTEGFKGVDYAFLVGAKPRGPGMERGDLLKENANIFKDQGKAINDNANTNCLTVVVGNPANTNALVASGNAPDVNPKQFTALTRLDQDRAIAQIADKTGVHLSKIDKVSIWGNHSATQYPDISYATVDGKKAADLLDQKWLESEFIPRVQKRGAEIISARGASSAASAADASIKHMRDWAQGASSWVSMAVPSDGSYGIKEGIFCSYPVVCSGEGKYEIVQGLEIDQFSKKKIDASVKELFEERNAVKKLIK